MQKIDSKKLIFIAIGFHLLAVIFSEGFHRPDEHLGLIRWTAFKLGQIPESILSWEYPAKIRPWIQPYFLFFQAKVLNLLGIENPFTISFFFRLSHSILALYSSYFLFKKFSEFINSNYLKSIVFPFSLLIWFVPFFHARTSNENLATSIFAFGLYFLFHCRTLVTEKDTSLFKNPFQCDVMAGIFLALSIVIRFQMVLMVVPAVLWLIIFYKVRTKSVIAILIGSLITLAFMFATDMVGYGTPTFTPWNYLEWNIFKGKASSFGTSPWFYYFSKTFSRGIPPLSLLLLLPTLFFWVKKPKHLLTWITLPFFLIHSLIAHKEIRFIFPLILVVPTMILILFDQYKDRIKLNKFIVGFLLFINLSALIISSVKSAHSPISFYRFLYHSKEISQVTTLNLIRDQLFFYQGRDIHFVYEEDAQKALASIKNSKDESYFLMDKQHHIQEFENLEQCKVKYLSYPNILVKLLKKYSPKSKIWALYHCKI